MGSDDEIKPGKRIREELSSNQAFDEVKVYLEVEVAPHSAPNTCGSDGESEICAAMGRTCSETGPGPTCAAPGRLAMCPRPPRAHPTACRLGYESQCARG